MTENTPRPPEASRTKLAKIEETVRPEDIILIDKPAGLSSFGVVARVRRILSEKADKKVKVGHTGTLDPFSTGLLILLANKATKLSNQFLKLDKWYEATIYLGKTSTTGDPEGKITDYQNAKNTHCQNTDHQNIDHQNADCSTKSPHILPPSRAEIEKTIAKFIGQIDQTVPSFSAVKINGQRAYQLARRGEAVKMPTRKVEIYAIEILSYDFPQLVIKAHVSSGTYIRTLGEDIGKTLGVGAYLTALRRTRIGDFDIAAATSLEDFMKHRV